MKSKGWGVAALALVAVMLGAPALVRAAKDNKPASAPSKSDSATAPGSPSVMGSAPNAAARADSATRAPMSPGAPAPGAPSIGGEQVDGVAAVVGDDVVLQSDVDEQVYLLLQQNNARPDSLQVQQLRKDVLDKLIDDRLIVAEAHRENLSVTDAEVDKNVDDAIADTKKRLGSDAAYQAELKNEGMSEDALRKRYHDEVSKQLLANALLRKSLPKIDVTPTDAEKYFTEHGDKFPKRPASIHAMVIFLPIQPDSLEKLAVRRKAAAALARIKAGEPFSRLAQNLSEDPGTASSGGDLGWFKRGSLDSTFEEAAFKLPVGVVSGIVQTPFGYHLIKVEEADKVKGEIHARHILFRVTPTEADATRAQKRILDIRTQAAKGVDFGTLARRYSKYTGPATPEGDLGELPLNVFSPDFKAALDTLEIGELSPPLLNAQGYNLFKVVDRSPERAYQLAEVKDDLPEMVRQAKLKEQYDAYVADLRKKAHIEYR
jgi:peptidyl-prolyl cis-trans isomerase SurA